MVGSGMTGIIANSPIPIKQEKKIQNNDELNFFETNNLKRNKRENIQTLDLVHNL